MNQKLVFLVLVFLVFTIGGVVGYLIMAKAKRYVAAKAALTSSLCVFITIIIIKILMHDTGRVSIGDIGWPSFAFLIVFFTIKGILATNHLE